MTEAISDNYRELTAEEAVTVAAECDLAWQDAAMPVRQYEACVKGELEAWRRGEPVAPFTALVDCLDKLPFATNTPETTLLEIGASSGYYSEVLTIAGFRYSYTGLDYSEPFKALAESLYPGIDYRIGDTRDLPFRDDSFDVVVSGAVLMHVCEYAKAIKETARVSAKYVVFHRTPVQEKKATTFYEKEGYGVRMMEIHFNEAELLTLFKVCGLNLVYTSEIFFNTEEDFGHRSYVLKKDRGLRHVQV